MVVLMLAWPSSFCSTLGCMPLSIALVAYVCRRVCIQKRLIPALSHSLFTAFIYKSCVVLTILSLADTFSAFFAFKIFAHLSNPFPIIRKGDSAAPLILSQCLLFLKSSHSYNQLFTDKFFKFLAFIQFFRANIENKRTVWCSQHMFNFVDSNIAILSVFFYC